MKLAVAAATRDEKDSLARLGARAGYYLIYDGPGCATGEIVSASTAIRIVTSSIPS